MISIYMHSGILDRCYVSHWEVEVEESGQAMEQSRTSSLTVRSVARLFGPVVVESLPMQVNSKLSKSRAPVYSTHGCGRASERFVSSGTTD